VAKNDHFVALSECHFLNPATMGEIAYYPNTSRWWASVDGVMRAWSGRDLTGEWPHPIAEELIKYMDEAGVDVCFCLREGMMDISGQTVALSTNQFMLKLEYLVKEQNAKLCKVYQPEDDGPLDDKRMWPFYEKACELDIALTVHTGMSYVVPQPSSHTHPDTLDRVLLDFPELRIIAYHMGWPHTEELIGLAGKHQNLYLSMSGIVGWYERSPYRGYHAIGTALQWVDPSRIVMGLDLPFDDTKRIVDWVRDLQIPDELQKNYGYPEITDEIRAGILGENLARLAKIEPTKRIK
jgi:hypothetical protein